MPPANMTNAEFVFGIVVIILAVLILLLPKKGP